VLVFAACGEDEDERENRGAGLPPPTQTTPAPETETTPPTTVEEPEGEPGQPSPEDQPGGAGDEVPARTQALFSGRGGTLRPRLVRVAPFIAIRVELRSLDGDSYGLRCAGKSVSVDADADRASALLAGRRPGQRIACRPTGDHNGVAISASAEPGP
jgi:hypothetical protein